MKAKPRGIDPLISALNRFRLAPFVDPAAPHAVRIRETIETDGPNAEPTDWKKHQNGLRRGCNAAAARRRKAEAEADGKGPEEEAEEGEAKAEKKKNKKATKKKEPSKSKAHLEAVAALAPEKDPFAAAPTAQRPAMVIRNTDIVAAYQKSMIGQPSDTLERVKTSARAHAKAVRDWDGDWASMAIICEALSNGTDNPWEMTMAILATLMAPKDAPPPPPPSPAPPSKAKPKAKAVAAEVAQDDGDEGEEKAPLPPPPTGKKKHTRKRPSILNDSDGENEDDHKAATNGPSAVVVTRSAPTTPVSKVNLSPPTVEEIAEVVEKALSMTAAEPAKDATPEVVEGPVPADDDDTDLAPIILPAAASAPVAPAPAEPANAGESLDDLF